MIATWSRRAVLALACAGSAALLAACGSGSVVSDLGPKRFLTVGDGFADVGQNGYRFTINDDTLNWVQQFAAYYSVTVTPASAGGWGYAQGDARVDSPDTTSGTSAPSVKEQIDALLARTSFVNREDVLFINGGMADIVAAVNATGISAATTQTVQAAGKALGDQVQRVVNAGATHVVITGVYDLGHTPWARGLNQADAISALSIAFNDALLVELSDPKWAKTVLYFDAAQFFNFVYNNNPQKYPVDNVTDPVCTTPDATTCTPSTLVAGADPTRWMFADSLYLTPQMQRMFVDQTYLGNVYTLFRDRW